jgi:hypothetical protein
MGGVSKTAFARSLNDTGRPRESGARSANRVSIVEISGTRRAPASPPNLRTKIARRSRVTAYAERQEAIRNPRWRPGLLPFVRLRIACYEMSAGTVVRAAMPETSTATAATRPAAAAKGNGLGPPPSGVPASVPSW